MTFDSVEQSRTPPAPETGQPIVEVAMSHLGNVLMILAELHPEDRCDALEQAMVFYNEHTPNAMIAPVDGYETRLVHVGPLWYAIAAHMARSRSASPESTSQ